VIAGDDLPEDVWVHFSELVDEAQMLDVGARVSFDVQDPVDETGFRFRAVAVRPA
jgi:cold shock CspA family protein